MGDDKGERELVVKCEDIRKMQIVDNQIWFMEYEGEVKTSRAGNVPSYSLNKYDMELKERECIISLGDENEGWSTDFGIRDFYCLDNGALLVGEMEEIGAKSLVCWYYILKDEEYVKIEDSNFIGKIDEYELFQYENLIICTRDSSINDKEAERIWLNGNSTHTTFIDYKRDVHAFDSRKSGWSNYVCLWSSKNQYYYLSFNNEIVIYDKENKRECVRFRAPFTGYIEEMMIENDYIYFWGLEWDHTNRKAFCYSISEDVITELDVLNYGKEIYFDGETVIVVRGDKLQFYTIEKNIVSQEKQITLPPIGRKSEYYAEVAGEWIFVYERNKDEAKLIDRISINSIDELN